MEAESPVMALCVALVPDLQRTAGTEAAIGTIAHSPKAFCISANLTVIPSWQTIW